MISKEKKVGSIATVANAVQLGNSIVTSLAGDTLNGPDMKEFSQTFSIHLSNALKKKGVQ